MNDEQIKAIEQYVFDMNNADSHADIAQLAEEAGLACPVCTTCETVWATLHPEDTK